MQARGTMRRRWCVKRCRVADTVVIRQPCYYREETWLSLDVALEVTAHRRCPEKPYVPDLRYA